MLDFTLCKSAGSLAPRLGRLSLAGRKTINTPDFLGNTSRGAVPHISQDNYRSRTTLGGVYVALEDFVEKHPQKIPPILQFPGASPLRRFIALPNDALLVLGARRSPPTQTPMSNTNSSLAIQTSVGFKQITSEYYGSATRKLEPDIVVALADIPFGQTPVGSKRKDKMSDRTENWVRDIIAKRDSLDKSEQKWAIFAPFLPIDRDLQSWYLEHLVDEMKDKIQGIAVCDAFLMDDLPEDLAHLPRLSFHAPKSPQEILRQVSLGMDLFTIPFVNEATDAGIALDFEFPPLSSSPTDAPPETQTSGRKSLGIDMWTSSHSTSLTPLSTGCPCYACTNHYRAYIQHLLNAKEMLGWVLIQLHNHSVLSSFFASIRASIERGTFESDIAAFEAFYEPKLPEKTGQGPRVRGYQYGAEEHGKGGRKNEKGFRRGLGAAEGEEEKVKVYAAHGQQPNKNPGVQDVIDDEAITGLVDVEGVEKVEDLKFEDDERKA
ncbi:tRNA-guanine transglycosylase family protein [Sporormia fimetaria CBS 119925]|uniref:Queuine tRNA-ribosyltransferase accessory subunit 2 n=1 Tax=Sporormia fimetaria CBS 119925 TaxID=1340428 RepID=A0A6A6UWP4_9PLEO|nr:tRNA-guanine transglycosylase family protein [Sporormia fimetaria CBS 119925]